MARPRRPARLWLPWFAAGRVVVLRVGRLLGQPALPLLPLAGGPRPRAGAPGPPEPPPFQLPVVERDEGPPPHEARPGVEAEPAGDHGKDEDERELEDRSGEQQPEEADARPEHPLLQRDERGIAAGAPRP